jgi:hypothetical protein
MDEDVGGRFQAIKNRDSCKQFALLLFLLSKFR